MTATCFGFLPKL